jgi:hypothetical protein
MGARSTAIKSTRPAVVNDRSKAVGVHDQLRGIGVAGLMKHAIAAVSDANGQSQIAPLGIADKGHIEK